MPRWTVPDSYRRQDVLQTVLAFVGLLESCERPGHQIWPDDAQK